MTKLRTTRRPRLRVAGEPEAPLFNEREREMFHILNAQIDGLANNPLPQASERHTLNAFEMGDRIVDAIAKSRAVCGDDPEMLRAAVASLCYSQLHVVEELARRRYEDKAAASGLGRRRRRS
jgi:hypothetical protein